MTPGGQTAAVGYCERPRVMVVHVVQHMAECKAHAVIDIPDVHKATARSLEIPKIGSFGFPHYQNGVRKYVFVRYGMRAVDVKNRNA